RKVASAPFGVAQFADQLMRGPCRFLPARSGERDRLIAADRFGQLSQFVWVIPVHPVAEADGLFGLPGGTAQRAFLAGVAERVDAGLDDRVLREIAQLAFDLAFNPETLAVEAVLV